MLRAIATSQFRKDYKRAIKRGKDIAKLDDIIRKLATGEPLDIRHRDHALVGNWASFRECHIEPDWLLIYRIESDVLVLTLVRTGTHGDFAF